MRPVGFIAIFVDFAKMNVDQCDFCVIWLLRAEGMIDHRGFAISEFLSTNIARGWMHK